MAKVQAETMERKPLLLNYYEWSYISHSLNERIREMEAWQSSSKVGIARLNLMRDLRDKLAKV